MSNQLTSISRIRATVTTSTGNSMSALRKFCSPIRLLTVALLTVGTANTAKAGYYTDNVFALNAIYSQTNFADKPIYFRFESLITLTSSLATINSTADFNALRALGMATPVVSMFFIDQINFCGIASVGIDGCASTPGNILAFDSTVGPGVVGHELGHNFGLQHDNTDPGNIMNANSAETDLTLEPFQVATILASNLIQFDGAGNRFVDVQPYALVAGVAVPEPSTSLLMALGLGLVSLVRLRSSVVS